MRPSSAEQEWIGALDQRTDAPFDQRREYAVDFPFAAGIDDMELPPERAHRFPLGSLKLPTSLP